MIDYKDRFAKAYKTLNSKQKEAVDAIEGPVMVVAGPGTGKTQILTLRIANILRLTDTAPANILALTFTENAAANMRRRLAEIIGSPAYKVVISTFHSFCNEIIKKYPEEFPRIIGSSTITEIDQITIIEKLIETLPLKLLRPFGDPLLYTKAILSSINNLKREGVMPEEFTKLVLKESKGFETIPDLRHEKGAHKGKIKAVYERLRRDIDKNQELALIYSAYEQELTTKKLYDYSDMIMEVLRELRTNQSLLLSLQEEHQYILVDEHQDTNNAQNKILELLVSFHDNPNLFVVGDEKQAIFRFQGASLENFYYFNDQYPEAHLVTLEANYRSTQTILDHAHELLAGKVPLQAKSAHNDEYITIIAASNQLVEQYAVAENIKEKLKSGVSAEEIAVLYRDNRDASAIGTLFGKLEIPYVVESDEDLLTDNDIRKLLLLLRAVHNFNSNELVAQALHIDFLGLSPVDIYRLIRESSSKHIPLFEILTTAGKSESIKLEKTEAVAMFATNLGIWNQASHNLDLLPLLEKVVKESGMLEYLAGSGEARKRLETLASFYDEVVSVVESHPQATLGDFLTFIDTAINHNVLLKKKRRTGAHGYIRLMTIHKSKGLEFTCVYIMGAYDGHIGGRAIRDKLALLPAVYQLRENSSTEAFSKSEEDERRLFYVALTRAKQCVVISYAVTSDSGREQIPSQFISELRPELLTYADMEPVEEKVRASRAILLAQAPVKTGSDLYDKEFIGDLFRDHGLSVTALNNYLLCPWQYFYRNLIRLPFVPEKHQLYGIAIHGALRDFFARAKEGELTKDFLLTSFERHVHQVPLSNRDLVDTHIRGAEALSGWFDAYQGLWNIDVLTEFSVGAVELTPDIKLTGTLDKIEFIGSGNEVNVVDYKTGKPKSRNAIMGDTQDSEGNYYRQLVFYKILLDQYENTKYRMVSGEIDFIEPNDTGKYKKEKFEIPESDVIELVETIKRVGEEIINLKFWDTTCENKDCEYCALRRLMRSAS